MVQENGNGLESGESPWDLGILQAALEKRQQARNATPDVEMGNLSPNTVHRLLYEPWGGEESMIRFQTNLPHKAFAGAKFFRRAHRLLEVVQTAGGVKTTPKGNLTRTLVRELIADPEMAADEPDAVAPYQKTMNERDFFPLHIAKLVSRSAGLLRLAKGRLTLTARGVQLLGEDQAGALYARLFKACFHKFNLAYAYRQYLDAPALQSCAGYTLYRLGSEARDWRSPEALYPEVFLPAVRAQVEKELENRVWGDPVDCAAGRILRPLLDFGLLEGRYERRPILDRLEAVRLTPLHEQFLVFEGKA